jgi:hypothetical protein
MNHESAGHVIRSGGYNTNYLWREGGVGGIAIAYWKMNESTGTRADEAGRYLPEAVDA